MVRRPSSEENELEAFLFMESDCHILILFMCAHGLWHGRQFIAFPDKGLTKVTTTFQPRFRTPSLTETTTSTIVGCPLGANVTSAVEAHEAQTATKQLRE